jgi:hypothetical protein
MKTVEADQPEQAVILHGRGLKTTVQNLPVERHQT